MSAGINNVVLVGRLTKDVNLRTTKNGTAVGTFTLAVDRSTKDAEGNREADYINCVIWNTKYSKKAENLATYAHKGSMIGITGSIQTRHYPGKDGKEVYVTEVMCHDFKLLESQRSQSGDYYSGYNAPQSGFNQAQGNQPQPTPQAPQAGNFSQQAGGWSTPAQPEPDINVSSDDLPF
ncbi:single-stranded DNA-binding protein [Lactobacillus nasalidis]|uniref:Single-stranded DNA-binding protein n=1 Tax=Lactobacillus nasalidis TaxID=2797258 RepID=A0ABQ3W7Y5_9LACO|nr:single-stranded DNA-binding protein [Lactobacillus nasalidis]GHW01454.1 single-stranded DNA-binding protein [Lactobacillus nasalidis]